jgi:hypothetical protein
MIRITHHELQTVDLRKVGEYGYSVKNSFECANDIVEIEYKDHDTSKTVSAKVSAVSQEMHPVASTAPSPSQLDNATGIQVTSFNPSTVSNRVGAILRQEHPVASTAPSPSQLDNATGIQVTSFNPSTVREREGAILHQEHPVTSTAPCPSRLDNATVQVTSFNPSMVSERKGAILHQELGHDSNVDPNGVITTAINNAGSDSNIGFQDRLSNNQVSSLRLTGASYSSTAQFVASIWVLSWCASYVVAQLAVL